MENRCIHRTALILGVPLAVGLACQPRELKRLANAPSRTYEVLYQTKVVAEIQTIPDSGTVILPKDGGKVSGARDSGCFLWIIEVPAEGGSAVDPNTVIEQHRDPLDLYQVPSAGSAEGPQLWAVARLGSGLYIWSSDPDAWTIREKEDAD